MECISNGKSLPPRYTGFDSMPIAGKLKPIIAKTFAFD